MIAALRRLASRIDSEWKAAGYRPRDLPPVAARLLAETRPDRLFDLGALADWTLSRQRFPAACNPFGPLGPPAFTVWSNPRFFVNAYAYTTPEVVVHDHDFAGAFLNLSGTTIHCTFDFADAERVGPAVRTGALRVAGLEVIREGDVRPIEPGSGFIHQVWHLDRPTVVLVIRTPPLTPAPRQFQYLRPALATQVFRDDTLSVGVPERFRYRQKMAECLRTTPKGVDYVRTLVERERPWDAVWHLLENWRYLRAAGALDDTLACGTKHQGAWFAAMAGAGSEVETFYSINWQRVGAAEDRIVLALLLTFGSWRPIREALADLLPERDPAELVTESLAGLAAAGTIPLHLPDEARVMLSCSLRSEGSDEAWRRAVRESFDIADRGGWAAARALDRSLRGETLLRPLFDLA